MTETTLKHKRGWLELKKGEYYLTSKAVIRELRISEQEFRQLLRTPQGSLVRKEIVYTQLHTSIAKCFFNLDDVKLLSERYHDFYTPCDEAEEAARQSAKLVSKKQHFTTSFEPLKERIDKFRY